LYVAGNKSWDKGLICEAGQLATWYRLLYENEVRGVGQLAEVIQYGWLLDFVYIPAEHVKGKC